MKPLAPHLNRRQWIAAAGAMLIAGRTQGQSRLLPLDTTGLDHLSITVPDSAAAATFYGRIFDPQVFHERTGVQRYYVRLGAAYLAFGPREGVAAFIDHISATVIDFVEDDFPNPEIQDQIRNAGLTAPGGVLPMLSDPDNLRLQLVNATHGLFDTLMPGGRVTIEPPVFIPMGLDHIIVSVADLDLSANHYGKLFGTGASQDGNTDRVWFAVGDSRLGLEAVSGGGSPGFSKYGVRVAAFERGEALRKLAELGVSAQPGTEDGTVRFEDLHGLTVEVVAG